MSRKHTSRLPINVVASPRCLSYLKRITSHWQKATASILEVAALCADANSNLMRDEKRLLLEEIPFSAATFSKLATIGSNQRLRGQRLRKLLPPSYSIIYAVAQLDHGELKAAVREKVISPTSTRAQIERWVAKRRVTGVELQKLESKTVLELAFYAEIRLPSNIPKEKLAEIGRFLAPMKQKFGAEILQPLDLPANVRLLERQNRAVERFQGRVLLTMRSLVRKRIRSLRKAAKSSNKDWGLLEDEVSINVPRNELADRLREVLVTLGTGDDFDELYKEAEATTDAPFLTKLQAQIEAIPFADATIPLSTKELAQLRAQIRQHTEPSLDFSQFKW